MSTKSDRCILSPIFLRTVFVSYSTKPERKTDWWHSCHQLQKKIVRSLDSLKSDNIHTAHSLVTACCWIADLSQLYCQWWCGDCQKTQIYNLMRAAKLKVLQLSYAADRRIKVLITHHEIISWNDIWQLVPPVVYGVKTPRSVLHSFVFAALTTKQELDMYQGKTSHISWFYISTIGTHMSPGGGNSSLCSVGSIQPCLHCF